MKRRSKDVQLRNINFLSSWMEEEIPKAEDHQRTRSSCSCKSPSVTRKADSSDNQSILKNELHFQRIRNSPVIRRKLQIKMAYKTAQGNEIEIQLPHT